MHAHWLGRALVIALFAVVAVAAVLRSGGTPPASVDGEVVLGPDAQRPRPVPSPTFSASPFVVVLCSDLSEHRVPLSEVPTRRWGALVDLHGSPCIITWSPPVPPRHPSPT